MSNTEQTDSEKAEATAIAASKLLAEQDAEAQAAALTAPLRTDGPTLAEFVGAGYKAENYPPEGYAVKEPAPAPLPTERPMGPSGAVAIQAFLAKKQAEEDAKALAG